MKLVGSYISFGGPVGKVVLPLGPEVLAYYDNGMQGWEDACYRLTHEPSTLDGLYYLSLRTGEKGEDLVVVEFDPSLTTEEEATEWAIANTIASRGQA